MGATKIWWNLPLDLRVKVKSTEKFHHIFVGWFFSFNIYIIENLNYRILKIWKKSENCFQTMPYKNCSSSVFFGGIGSPIKRYKVQIFWEGHRKFKKFSHFFWHYRVILRKMWPSQHNIWTLVKLRRYEKAKKNYIKTKEKIVSTFMALSEYMNL